MKKILHLSTFLLLSWCLSLAGMQRAWASHAQAGQLSYSYVSTAANGDQTYLVKVEFYRDCSGISAPTSFQLTAANSCGSTGRTATLNPVGQPIIGSPYCASVQALAVCPLNGSAPSGAPANFATYTYQNTIVLPPAAEWILSVEESARPSVANISAGTLRLEARLYSLITPVGGGTPVVIHNDSPIFSSTNLPVPFVYVNQQATISFAAADNDRLNGPNGLADRLVYTLDRPLNGCNSYETYSAYPGTGCVTGIDPQCARRLITCTGSAGTYSQNLPISVANDTIFENGSTTRPACPTSNIATATVRPRFSFNASQASFTFTPNRYLSTPSANGDNKYAVVGRVDEYRTINGREYLVGSSRRDFLVIVINGTGNTLPSNPTGSAGPPRSGVVLNITRDTTDLEIKTCNYSRVRFNFTDPDNTSATPPSPLQNLTVFYPSDINSNLLQGGDIGSFTISRNGTATPSATFYFQPISSLAGTTILVPLRIEDDGCPAKGIQYRTIRIRIVNYKGATAVAAINAPGLGNSAPNPAICAGGSLQITGAVDRPDSVRVATTGNVILQTYSYQWQALNRTPAQAGMPAVTTTPNITVAPTVTTRYRLTIAPLQGFGIGLCGDTTSVLVRVVPAPTVTIVASNTTVCAGSPVTLTATARRATDALTDVYTYRWTGPNGYTATGASVTVTPTTAGTYTVVASGAPQYGCTATAQTSLQVAPAAVANFTQTAAVSSRPGSLSLIPPVTFSFSYSAALNPVTPGFQIDSVRWTYQLVRNTSGAAVTAPQVRFSNSRTTATTPPLEPGYYTIRLYVNTRAAGTNCPENVFQQEVFVPDVVTPNIITPNGDNYNDVFVVNSAQRGGKLEIFNRWGTKIEEYSNYQNNWSAANQGPGVYYYYITDRSGNKTKGWIEVVK